MSKNQPIKVTLSDSTKKTLASLQEAENFISNKTAQIKKIDGLIEDLQGEIEQLGKTPELACIEERVEQIINCGEASYPQIDVRDKLEREALLQQKLELVEGLKNKREACKNELDRPDNTAFRLRQELPRDLAEDWVKSLSEQDRAIFFFTQKLTDEAGSKYVKPFSASRVNDYTAIAKKTLLVVAGR